jgi:broad specificity phosphatase PhoE
MATLYRTLYLVRHGQASFGADDYDLLSPLGQQQSRLLGEHFKQQGIAFQACLVGSLKRHAQTLAGIQEGLGQSLPTLTLPGLNEYIPEALIAAVHPEPLVKITTPETYRHHFQLLRRGMTAWMDGSAQPVGMPSFADFSAGVAGALAHVRSQCAGDVLLVSSGGPISTAVAQVLGCGPQALIDLNFRLRNSAVSEMVISPKRLSLLTFNTLPHLLGQPGLVTAA